ncbi:MAG: hypothetical protein GY793_11560 [Proteobacteria bacterium]|nr:hypothetical protein [Pseudomonadota bacterium]
MKPFPDINSWLQHHGFKPDNHPFEQLVAETDQRLGEYFKQFPYFEQIEKPKCSFLFLQRGSGKSANRVMLKKQCDNSLKSGGPDAKLAVVYTDFHQLIQKKQVTITDHIT